MARRPGRIRVETKTVRIPMQQLHEDPQGTYARKTPRGGGWRLRENRVDPATREAVLGYEREVEVSPPEHRRLRLRGSRALGTRRPWWVR